MDRLLAGIESQTIALSTLDMMPSIMNVPFYVYYSNDVSHPDFMPTELLHKSFYLALLDFPPFVGYFEVDGSGRGRVVVDKDNLNLPAFLESQSSVHFGDIQAAKFSCDALPAGAATAGLVTTSDSSGTIKPIHVHIVRLRDNSGIVLFVSIAHYLVDGVSYCEFLNRWADICKRLGNGETPEDMPLLHVSHSRSTLFEHLPDDRRELDDPTREMITTRDLFTKWLTWLSPKTRAKVIATSTSFSSIESHIFHLSASNLASLRASTQEFVTTGERISDNDVITALLQMAVAQSEAECKQEAAASRGYLSSLASYIFPSMYKQGSEFVTQIAFDTRPRLKGLGSARFVGNAVMTRCLASPMDSLTSGINPQSLALAALSVRKLVNGIDPQYIGQHIDTLHKDPSCFMCQAAHSRSKSTMMVTNHSRFELYKADFGRGTPVWVSPLRPFFPNILCIMPTPPSADGYIIYMSMTTPAMAKLLLNEFWASVTSLVY
ncbi:hypothetical protein GGI21_002180 [Coemansia aciculifera]|nr:hypothetical protein GGI21_002180 [Coemansia aciculifera]